MHSVISRSSHVTMPDGNVLCIHFDESIAPFSWYRYIVMSQKDYDEGGSTVIMHESMHIKAGIGSMRCLPRLWLFSCGIIPQDGLCATSCRPFTNMKPTTVS